MIRYSPNSNLDTQNCSHMRFKSHKFKSHAVNTAHMSFCSRKGLRIIWSLCQTNCNSVRNCPMSDHYFRLCNITPTCTCIRIDCTREMWQIVPYGIDTCIFLHCAVYIFAHVYFCTVQCLKTYHTVIENYLEIKPFIEPFRKKSQTVQRFLKNLLHHLKVQHLKEKHLYEEILSILVKAMVL